MSNTASAPADAEHQRGPAVKRSATAPGGPPTSIAARDADIAILPKPARDIFYFLIENGATTFEGILRGTPRLPGWGALSWVFALCDLGLICRDDDERWQAIEDEAAYPEALNDSVPEQPYRASVLGTYAAVDFNRNPREFAVLSILDSIGPGTVEEIAEDVGISVNSALHALRFLARRGLAAEGRSGEWLAIPTEQKRAS